MLSAMKAGAYYDPSQFFTLLIQALPNIEGGEKVFLENLVKESGKTKEIPKISEGADDAKGTATIQQLPGPPALGSTR